ncbi:TonB-dependent receptor domain-containing protein [Xanthomonas oryzae]|uniref:TonB-dependent receptor domain-containing protein n=1 Tax=Xanthomonas oryzae TaxID=347 RepID=UPI0010334060|nr:TonB-dependent receptor [Xanthomonas oryzae]QBH02309.1 hypothetical protein EYC57_00950 [Xanthomonas oryzae]
MKNHRTVSTLPPRSLLCCTLAASLLAANPAMAQSSNATLRGQVASAQSGSEVVVTNIATGSVRRAPVNANGNYTIVGLQPGTYKVESNGISRTVTLSVASSATVDLGNKTAAAPAGDATTLDTVTVNAPMMRDVKTSEVGNTVSLRQIQQLPQATRNFLEFADTVPGMVFTIDQDGNTKLRAGASNASSSNLYIDGVSQKSYVSGGGIAGQNETQGNPFPQLAIGEYKVITSNYKAEYGQISGAAITAATKSGTNQFHGEAFYRFTNQDLRKERPDEENGKVDSQTKEYGFAIGGPLIQDRMHFFFAYEGKDNVAPKSVQPSAEASPFVGLLPSNLRDQFGASNMPFTEDLYFGKIDVEPTDNDRIELATQYRDETQVSNVGGQNAPDRAVDKINKDKRTSLRWQHSADSWFNEAIITTEDSSNVPTPRGTGNGSIYTYVDRTEADPRQWVFLNTGAASGEDFKLRSQKGWSFQNDLTFNALEWHGEHTIKTGVTYRDIKLTSRESSSLNPQFSYEVGQNGIAPVPFQVRYIRAFDNPGQVPVVESPSKQYGIYLQDDWAVNDKLMLNIGVRYDYEDTQAYTDFVTSQPFINALYSDDPDNPGQPWANRLLPSGINVADYISTGNNRKNFKDAWAPRFGFSYDFFGDESAVLHGGAGRSYDRNLFEQLALESVKAALSPVVVYFSDAASRQPCFRDDRVCTAWNPGYLNGIDQLNTIPGTNDSSELFMFNNKLKTPYSDQYSIGISNQVGDWLTDVTFQRVLAYDGLVMSLVNRYPNGAYFDSTGSVPWGEPVPGYRNTILGYNGLEQRSSQFLLSAEKPYTKESGWGLNLSYTHTSARQNRTIDEPFAFDKATIRDYPFVKSDAVAAHRFVASGSIDGPWGVTFGAKLVLATPEPINTIACYGFTDPDGGTCQAVGVTPPGNGKFLVGGKIWGYRTVDLQANKEFTVVGDFKLNARINVLNAFNFKNYTQYQYNSFGSDGRLQPDITVVDNGEISYVPRSVVLEIGAKF